MYAHQEIRDVEEVCYEQRHTEKVVEAIKNNFNKYFDDFLQTEAGNGITLQEFDNMKRKMGIDSEVDGTKKDIAKAYKRIITDAYNEFEKDRKKYLDIFDEETLKECEDDPAAFKSKVLKNECPIIHSTLYNKRAKELDKYRGQFSIADPKELLDVVTNLCQFGNEYQDEIYDKDTYEDIDNYEKLNMWPMDTDDFTVYGVIGGGIKSHMLFKVHPSIFPNRSRNAIWALWYLTGQKSFGCKMDSEFLMIDVSKNITQQNYFYPYELFVYYAFEIYKLLRDKAHEIGAYIDTEYRYVIVDVFLDFIAKRHDEEISFLKESIRDGGWGYV